ncbi:carboxymuconolactone decarboxylase family protein [Undibacterium sp.]|jgi:AhpD family alkylhydroperoxidase|uniref:carboxymuconolactone decarboxylase family protein n=1 Tax=Undibacterium sp. TaxID=1914977 RepID=UPI002B676502|nr:carboxymuconolactone decarboxylase family protein [Undibacterium sp.]HTD06734.1 carboxymuconolactone decarboxylase family protein [Undibacterium sp.]
MILPVKRLRQFAIARAVAGFLAASNAAAQTLPDVQNPQAAQASATATYQDIEATLGLVPGFFKAFPQAGIAGSWAEFKNVQLSENTLLTPKVKQLIGLAVSAQVPCSYCVYFHTAVARAYGATDGEIQEAVALAAISRHWSTVLNGMAVDLPTFKREIDASLRMGADKASRK